MFWGIRPGGVQQFGPHLPAGGDMSECPWHYGDAALLQATVPGSAMWTTVAGHFGADSPRFQSFPLGSDFNVPHDGRNARPKTCDNGGNNPLAQYDKAVIDCSRIR